MPEKDVVAQARQAYGAGWQPALVSRAPGRLELLGNHIDYSGGPVLAGTIDRYVTARAFQAPEHAGTTSLLALDIDAKVSSVNTMAPPAVDQNAATRPIDFLSGILHALHERNLRVRDGLQIVITGDIPRGFGMSSSAALCVAITNLLSASPLTDQDVVAIARRAEHLTGAPVGAMDQSASVAGGVILFDGVSGAVRAIEPDLGDHSFVVAHSGVHRSLNRSAYPRRVEESQQALKLLNQHEHLLLDHLAALSPDSWRRIRQSAPSWLTTVLRMRLDHVVSESARVREGVAAIKNTDWQRFGSLMNESGQSSAKDYEISHPVVEELIAELQVMPGVLGARMMGGGEGGPALALVDASAIEDIRRALAQGFFGRHRLDARTSFEACTFGPGASLTLSDGEPL